MNALVSNILGLFSSDYQGVEPKEDCDNYQIVAEMGSVSKPDIDILKNFLGQIPARDDIFMSFPNENLVCNSRTDSELEAFVNAVENYICRKNNVKFKFVLTKNRTDGVRSVYDDVAFYEYIKEKEFVHILSVFSNRIVNHRLVFEYQDKQIPTLFSSSICFKSADRPAEWRSLDDDSWKKKFEKSRELCHWHKNNVNITPDDLYFEQDGEGIFNLKELLDKSCLVFTWMHLVDYVQFKEDCVELFLSGLKSYLLSIPSNNIENKDYDVSSLAPLFSIYQWCYSEGDYFDKIMIVRNILSLNIDKEKLSIPESTIHSVDSNFKILQKENVEHYLKLRNDLSDKLIELQKSINELVDGYLSEYKKNIVAFLSFIVPMIVVRAITKGQILEMFSPRLLLIIVTSLFLSYVYYRFSRKEYKVKADMMRKQFRLIKERYHEVLSEGEIEFIFADSNEEDEKSYVSFLKEKENYISNIWVGTLGIIFLLSLFLFITQ